MQLTRSQPSLRSQLGPSCLSVLLAFFLFFSRTYAAEAFYKMLYWIDWIVLLSLEPLAGELEYASVEWSAAGVHGRSVHCGGRSGLQCLIVGVQHWVFNWRLSSLLLMHLLMPKSI